MPLLKVTSSHRNICDFNLQVQDSENKKIKGIWDRTEETPHKDAKEMIFFPPLALPQFWKY